MQMQLKRESQFPTRLKYKYYMLSQYFPEEFQNVSRNLKSFEEKVNLLPFTISDVKESQKEENLNFSLETDFKSFINGNALQANSGLNKNDHPDERTQGKAIIQEVQTMENDSSSPTMTENKQSQSESNPSFFAQEEVASANQQDQKKSLSAQSNKKTGLQINAFNSDSDDDQAELAREKGNISMRGRMDNSCTNSENSHDTHDRNKSLPVQRQLSPMRNDSPPFLTHRQRQSETDINNNNKMEEKSINEVKLEDNNQMEANLDQEQICQEFLSEHAQQGPTHNPKVEQSNVYVREIKDLNEQERLSQLHNMTIGLKEQLDQTLIQHNEVFNPNVSEQKAQKSSDFQKFQTEQQKLNSREQQIQIQDMEDEQQNPCQIAFLEAQEESKHSDICESRKQQSNLVENQFEQKNQLPQTASNVNENCSKQVQQLVSVDEVKRQENFNLEQQERKGQNSNQQCVQNKASFSLQAEIQSSNSLVKKEQGIDARQNIAVVSEKNTQRDINPNEYIQYIKELQARIKADSLIISNLKNKYQIQKKNSYHFYQVIKNFMEKQSNQQKQKRNSFHFFQIIKNKMDQDFQSDQYFANDENKILSNNSEKLEKIIKYESERIQMNDSDFTNMSAKEAKEVTRQSSLSQRNFTH